MLDLLACHYLGWLQQCELIKTEESWIVTDRHRSGEMALQLRDVHHIMDLAAGWKLEAICHFSHAREDLVWSEELERKLLAASWGE
jgi:hypothetical protein